MKIIRTLDCNLKNRYPELNHSSLTIGNFESVHFGHLNLIRSLSEKSPNQGAKKILISFEPSPNAFFLKTKMRIYGVKQKLELLCDQLDYLILLRFNQALANQKAEDFLYQIKQAINPIHISIGDDFCFGKNRLGNSEMIKHFCRSEKISFYQLHTIFTNQPNQFNQPLRYSTSLVRENLKKHHFAMVKKILSRSYCLKGKVRKGMALAGKIGFPTANIRLHFDPVFSGVFAVRVNLHSEEKNQPKAKKITGIKAIANLGRKPTIAGNHQNYFTLEVHLLDEKIAQTVPLTGKVMEVEFIQFIRSEQKFAGLDELKNQIKGDIEQAKKILG